MRVVNFGTAKVRNSMQRLAAELTQSGVQPRVVLGVLAGGKMPAEMLAEACGAIDIRFVTHRRKSSGKLKSAIVKGVKMLPRPIGDFARGVESRLLRHHGTRERSVDQRPNATLVESLAWTQSIDWSDRRPLVVVDDAVDSGRTLQDILIALESLGLKRAHVRVVCITVTQPAPLVRVDHCEFQQVLCRFPWSDDFRDEDEQDVD